MSIIGYIIWGLSILIALGYCFNIRQKAKNEQSREKAMELQGFLFSISVVLIPAFSISPFHLFWMFPASFLIGLLSISSPLRLLWIFSSIYFWFWCIGIKNIGRQFYVSGDYVNAVAAFKEEIAKNPKSAEAHFNLGLAYGKLGDYQSEINSYEEAIIHNPKIPEIYFNLGTAYNGLEHFNNAIEVLNEAIRLRPDYLKAHYTLCKVYAAIGDHENAMKEYSLIQKIDKNTADELKSVINS
jgi:tetratricopeptide (TPR) repeat protein